MNVLIFPTDDNMLSRICK